MYDTFILIGTICIILGFYFGWRFRNKRIAALENYIEDYKKDLLKSEMELSNLEAFFKHMKIPEPTIREKKTLRKRKAT